MRKAVSWGAVLFSLVLSLPILAAETTRTLRLELSGPDAARFRVENLAGSMKVTPATGGKVLAVATLHAESDKLADLMKFERVLGEGGTPTLRVIYPLDRYETIRYDAGRNHGGGGGLFGGDNTNTKYAGHRVKISSSGGVLLYADLEIQVPPTPGMEASFRNVVGKLDARGIEGKLKFDSASGDFTLKDLKGTVRADTGSGDVKAADLSGAFSCDTGSGDCTLEGFQGEKLAFDVGSGDVTVKSATVRTVSADTGSGDIRILASDVEEFEADTGSGDVTLESRGSGLRQVTADTGSGDVTLRLSPEATFEARADQGSGEIRMGYKDAEAIIEHRQVIGYRRGDSRIRIRVDTGSGDLNIEPLR